MFSSHKDTFYDTDILPRYVVRRENDLRHSVQIPFTPRLFGRSLYKGSIEKGVSLWKIQSLGPCTSSMLGSQRKPECLGSSWVFWRKFTRSGTKRTGWVDSGIGNHPTRTTTWLSRTYFGDWRSTKLQSGLSGATQKCSLHLKPRYRWTGGWGWGWDGDPMNPL